MLRGDVATARHLQGRRQVRQHHAQRFLVLCNVVGEGARHRVLQQPLIGDQALTVNRFHLLRVEIHRHYADERERTKDDVQNGDARWEG